MKRTDVAEFGCLPPRYDSRDYKLQKACRAEPMPESFQLFRLPEVKNQGMTSSCTAHAASSILEYFNGGTPRLSTQFLYGIKCAVSGHQTRGMCLGDACRIAQKFGDMLYEDCPGNEEVPGCFQKAELALDDAPKAERAAYFRIASYYTCKTVEDIKYAIVHHGPVLASIRWYDNFRATGNGILRGKESGKYAYHAVMLYGFNEDGFMAQNSWGRLWGRDGRFLIPYSIPIREAKAMIDMENTGDLVIPPRGKIIDVIYKAVNWLVNLLWRAVKR